MAQLKALFLVLVAFTSILLVEGEGEECRFTRQQEDANEHEALKYKMLAIFLLFPPALLGASIPFMGPMRPETNLFLVLKAFSAGVVLATGFVHMLPDAFEALSSSCLDEDNLLARFPSAAAFVAMLAGIVASMVYSCATSCHTYSSSSIKSECQGLTEILIAGNEAENMDGGEETEKGHFIIFLALALGIPMHSCIIGVALGASESPATIKPLVIGMCFYQLFQGIAFGGSLVRLTTKPELEAWKFVVLILQFSLLASACIVVGIGAEPYPPIIQGLINAASAGIFICMASHHLEAEFLVPRVQANIKLKLVVYLFLVLGAGCMSLLAKWS